MNRRSPLTHGLEGADNEENRPVRRFTPCCETTNSGPSACTGRRGVDDVLSPSSSSRLFVTFFDDIHGGNAVFGLSRDRAVGHGFVMYGDPLFVNFIGAKRGLLMSGWWFGARLIISGMCDSPVFQFLNRCTVWKFVSCWCRYLNISPNISTNASMPPSYLLGYRAMLYVGNVVRSACRLCRMTVLALGTPISSLGRNGADALPLFLLLRCPPAGANGAGLIQQAPWQKRQHDKLRRQRKEPEIC